MKYRKLNRDNRNRCARMIGRKHGSLMPAMDRERIERIREHDGRSYRYGSEGLTCSICAPTVWHKLERQTQDGRNAIAEYKECE